MATEYLPVGWEKLHEDARRLARLLLACAPEGGWRGMVAIARGGLVPAAILARELGCRMVECASVVTYDEEARGEPRLVKPPSAAGDGAGWLLVDDLVDSGTTLRLLRKVLPQAHVATLYAKPAGADLVHSYVQEVPQAVWILFPWDMAAQFTPPLVGPAQDGAA